MGVKPSSVLCCSPEQHSVNLNISTDISHHQVFDDEPIIHSNLFDQSHSQKSEKLEIVIEPSANILKLSTSETLDFPCLFELIPPETSARQGLDLVFIVELSSLISAVWLTSIKKCIWYSLTQLTKHDRISIIGFNDHAVKLCPLTSANKSNMNKIFGFIKNIEGSGGSNVIEGLSLGFSVLSNRRMCNTVSALILMAKGSELLEKARGITQSIGISTNFYLHSFGIGEHFAEFLNSLSTDCKGNYYNIPHPMALTQAFGSCFGELLSIYAENLKVSVELVPCSIPMSLEKVYLAQSHILCGKTTEVCAMIAVMPCFQLFPENFSVKILKILIKYKIVKTGEEVKVEKILEIPCFSYDHLLSNIEVNTNVVKHVFRFKLADLLYEILFEDSEKASSSLQEFNELIDYFNEGAWVGLLKDEIKSYSKLLQLGWNPALKSRILCSIQGYYNKSLFYIQDFQTNFQLDQQKMCKEIFESIRSNVRKANY